MTTLKSENHIAYKEWAAVAEALDRGLFTMSLRKGGIHEKRGEFSVEHREYFLFPTYIHQRASDVVPAVLPLLEASKRDVPPEAESVPPHPTLSFKGRGDPQPRGTIIIRHYATVEDAVYLEDLAQAHALEGLHPFTKAAVEMRFNYKKPGLWVILERLYRLPKPVAVQDDRLYAGCRSWVPLKAPLATAGARPVLSAADFAERVKAIRTVINGK